MLERWFRDVDNTHASIGQMRLMMVGLLAASLCAGCGGSGDDDVDGQVSDGGDADARTADSGTAIARGPSGRAESAVVYDPASGKLLVFGGDKGVVQNQMAVPDIVGDTWVLDTRAGTWTQIMQGGPTPRSRTVAVYDSNEQRAIVFGGRYRASGTTQYTLYNEVWAFHFQDNVWSPISTNGPEPTPRTYPAVGYDSMTRDIIVYGGNTSTSGLNYTPQSDIHAINVMTGNSRVLTPTGTPPAARHYAQFAFDEGRRRFIVFGGHQANLLGDSFGDTWALDISTATPSWTSLHPGGSGAPPAKFGGAMVYDRDRDRMLLFAGHNNTPTDGDISNELWQLNLATNAWSLLRKGDTITGERCIVGGSQVEPLGVNYATPDMMTPERRFKHGLAADPVGSRVLTVGGESDCAKLDDIWSLDLATTDGAWTRLLKATQGESCLRRADQCACFCN